ncbi:MAG: cytidylate kinase, partial [Candidatus Thioglobus sp.]|nr:cytidylate kinase [Candidatus Thioglobus sp.]
MAIDGRKIDITNENALLEVANGLDLEFKIQPESQLVSVFL